MRPLEILLVFLLIGLFIVSLTSPRVWLRLPRWVMTLPAFALLITALHLWLERARWQMAPAYLLVGVFSLIWLVRITLTQAQDSSQKRTGLQKLGSGLVAFFGLLTLALAAALPILFPVPNLPAPTGVYQVGTASFQLKDETRDEIYTDDINDKRELMIQVWYPATPKIGGPGSQRAAPWMARMDVVGPAIAQKLGFPSFLLSHAALVQSNSYANAPISEAEAAYPILIYSHGWTGFRQINANQSEDLASHGYIVVAVEHPYGALVSLFNDGRVILNKPDALPKRISPNFVAGTQLLEEVYARDVIFVLDELVRINGEHMPHTSAMESLVRGTSPDFATRLDLTRIGIFGHSTGGGGIVKVCARDPRCKVGIGQDTWLEPVPDDVIAHGLVQPFLFFRSEEWTKGTGPGDIITNRKLFQLVQDTKAPRTLIDIQDAGHYDFTMIGLLSPLASLLGIKGPVVAAGLAGGVLRALSRHRYKVREMVASPICGATWAE